MDHGDGVRHLGPFHGSKARVRASVPVPVRLEQGSLEPAGQSPAPVEESEVSVVAEPPPSSARLWAQDEGRPGGHLGDLDLAQSWAKGLQAPHEMADEVWEPVHGDWQLTWRIRIRPTGIGGQLHHAGVNPTSRSRTGHRPLSKPGSRSGLGRRSPPQNL